MCVIMVLSILFECLKFAFEHMYIWTGKYLLFISEKYEEKI